MIDTLIGPVEESELEITEKLEDIPCGQCLTRTYFKDGELVRQDIEIRLK